MPSARLKYMNEMKLRILHKITLKNDEKFYNEITYWLSNEGRHLSILQKICAGVVVNTKRVRRQHQPNIFRLGDMTAGFKAVCRSTANGQSKYLLCCILGRSQGDCGYGGTPQSHSMGGVALPRVFGVSMCWINLFWQYIYKSSHV